MGCCLSTNKTPAAEKSEAEAQSETNSYIKAAARNSKSPPLPPLEEETVKEVLSETPTQKPSFPNVENHLISPPSFLKIETDKPSSPPTPLPPPSFPIKLEEANNKDPPVEEISEVSDMCSLSESLSTTTIGEGRVDDGEVRQRVDRSPAKLPRKRPVSGEFTRTERGGKSSPARRFDQSPGRRNDALKPSQVHHHLHSSRDMGGGGGCYTNRRRVTVTGGGGARRDAGEGSARRSRSPATRPVTLQSPSSRAVSSPGRIPALGQEKERKPEEVKGDEGDLNLPTNESLENPLVSLECFIFL